MNIKKIIRETIDNFVSEIKSGSEPKRGRIYIPDFLYIPEYKINAINNESGGPHIKVLKSSNSKYGDFNISFLISPLLATAISQTKRGRTSREIEVNKAYLLKRYMEIFKDNSLFRGLLKKSLEGISIRPLIPSDISSVPTKEYYPSRILITHIPEDKTYVVYFAGGKYLDKIKVFENQ